MNCRPCLDSAPGTCPEVGSVMLVWHLCASETITGLVRLLSGSP